MLYETSVWVAVTEDGYGRSCSSDSTSEVAGVFASYAEARRAVEGPEGDALDWEGSEAEGYAVALADGECVGYVTRRRAP